MAERTIISAASLYADALTPHEHGNNVSTFPTPIIPDVLHMNDAPPIVAIRSLPTPRISIVGVGGAGMNALNHFGTIAGEGATIRRIALNTDAQTLAHSTADERFCLGESITQGTGAGGNPQVGERAAEASRHHIATLLRGSDLVFILAGLGGGTGTGAGPIVAQVAREMGALTIGMVTLPFSFEGTRRRHSAQQGLTRIAQSVDALIVLQNDRLLQVATQTQTLSDSFKLADEALRQGISGIADIVTVPGLINVDFADVRAILQGAGISLLAIGQASGQDRAIKAAEDAMSGGWMDVDIQGARRVLLHITGSADMSLHEVTEIASRIAGRIDAQAEYVFGAVIDPTIGDAIRVTLVAAGLPHFAG